MGGCHQLLRIDGWLSTRATRSNGGPGLTSTYSIVFMLCKDVVDSNASYESASYAKNVTAIFINLSGVNFHVSSYNVFMIYYTHIMKTVRQSPCGLKRTVNTLLHR